MTFAPKSIVRTLVVVVAIIVVSMIILVAIAVVMQGALTAALAVSVFRIGAVTPLLGAVTLVLIIIVVSMIRICNARRANVLVMPPPHAISSQKALFITKYMKYTLDDKAKATLEAA